MVVSWNVIKSFVINRALSIQWIEIENKYWLKVFDGPFFLECILNKGIEAENVTDFETNYKPYGNKSPTTKVIQQLGKDSYNLNTRAYDFIATKQTSTTHYFLLSSSQTIAIKGGVLFSDNSAWKDYIIVEIEDKDGVYFPAGTVIAGYIQKWFVFKSVVNEVDDISIAEIPAGLYLKVIYVSDNSATEDAKILLNLYSYTLG